jgi:formate dehydrogenase major subunit
MSGARFELDGIEVVAKDGETIWQAAKRLDIEIPHLCSSTAPDYRPDGNCRACVVEIEGERALAASCIRKPTPGMIIKTASKRARESRRLVFELLLADQPGRETAPDPDSHFWRWADRLGVTKSRFPGNAHPAPDTSHPAIAVNLDACIHCRLCLRACREIQVNDVIGMMGRGAATRVAFDLNDPMGQSSCVACGECVEACPTGALLPANLVDETGVGVPRAERKVDSLCPYCGVGCQLTFHIRGERLLFVEGKNGPANHARLCVKGRFGFDYIHHPHRLTHPLIRKAGAVKSADPDIDPTNPFSHFREASWEEALDAAASGFSRIRNDNGAGALAGFGSAKCSNEEAYLFQKLIRAGFGTNNVDHCTRLCHASSVAALMETIGSGAVTAPFSEVKNAEVIVVIGCNPAVNHPVAASFIKNAVKAGARLIVIDPRRQALSRHATHALQFRPGTDVALLNALLNVIITEGLHNKDYVAAHTEGFEELKARIQGCTPEAMAPICGIDAEVLRTVARTYANARTAMIFWGMGIAQHVHGTDNARCLIALALLTGHIGRPGSGLHPLRGQNNVQGASDVGLIPMFYPDYKSVEDQAHRTFFEKLWGRPLDPKAGLTVVEILNEARERQIRGMYIMGENPAMSDPDISHARAALAALDHLVVQDIFLTETAFHADVVLPATAFPEKDGSFTNTDRGVQLARKALYPPGEARPDWWITQEIARRMGQLSKGMRQPAPPPGPPQGVRAMGGRAGERAGTDSTSMDHARGLDWNYSHPRDVFAEMRQCMASIRGITWERLEREGAVTYPCEHENAPGVEVLFGESFPTPSGRGRFVPADVLPPDETPDEAFPMVLITGRILEHWHTGAISRRASVLDALEPEATAYLAPQDLDRLGIAAGEKVAISTRRGRIEIGACADDHVPEGTIFIPFCYVEAAANLLTNPALDPFGKIPEFKFCAVKAERME